MIYSQDILDELLKMTNRLTEIIEEIKAREESYLASEENWDV
nr:MAG TPA: hypothetical protein [Caudoviricetes sp.]